MKDAQQKWLQQTEVRSQILWGKKELLKTTHLQQASIPIMRNSGIVHKFPEKFVCSSYLWEE